MDLIIGGAYQGKREYAKRLYGLDDADIFTCRENGAIDFSARCIDAIEEYTLRCVRNGADPAESFRTHEYEWRESVLICADIFCGVVPMGAENRAWREATGRLCAYLAGKADTVTRMFCGLPQRLK